jgi:hypothetical protein
VAYLWFYQCKRAKSTFHVPFRPSLTGPYACGGRRRGGGYDCYSGGVIAVGRGPRLSPPKTLFSPIPSSLSLIFLVLWRRTEGRSSRRQGEKSRRFEWRIQRMRRGSDGGGQEWIGGSSSRRRRASRRRTALDLVGFLR